MTLAQYVHQYGRKISELSEETLKAVKDELKDINDGYIIDDSVLLRHEMEREG